MKITGIVTEYNPFHLGHNLHLQKAKEDTNADGVICIMSGNFIQRGGPALIDKWNRAIMAVKNGVDLVIELPLIYSISSAEGFADGSVKILDSTGVVDSLYFGSEHGSIIDLQVLANSLCYENINFKKTLNAELSKGLPFHTARNNALSILHPSINTNEILASSNNILAIEYLKALIKLNSTITPYTLKRAGANYNDCEIKSLFPSATAIRRELLINKDLTLLNGSLPFESYIYLDSLLKNNYKFVYPEHIFKYLKFKLLTEGNKLVKLPEIREGLDNKILKEIIYADSLDDLIMRIKSKRYTYTRISRILCSFFIGLENYPIKLLMKESPKYIRPLAFNERGSKILKQIKDKGNVDIISKVPKNITDSTLKLDLLGTKAYSIINPSISPIDDYLKSPIFVK